MIRIQLPWPPKELSPNARIHFHSKAAITRAYREGSYWLAYNAVEALPDDGEIMVRIDFHPPDKRRRDLDGMLSSIKAGLDGIADALAVNDNRFAFQIHRREPVKGGSVIVTIGEP